MLSKILKVAVIATITAATAFTSANTAHASPGAKPVIATIRQNETPAAFKADPQIRKLVAEVRAGAIGEIKLADGTTDTISLVNGRLVVTTPGKRVPGPSVLHFRATPNLITGICVTAWQGFLAYSQCAGALGWWEQYIKCSGINGDIWGPLLFAPPNNSWLGFCPNLGNVIYAGVQ